MKIYRKDPDNNFEQWRDWHVLTMAKDRGAALELYARGIHGLDIDSVVKFAKQVNDSDKTLTLHPEIPVSSIPFRYFIFVEEFDLPNQLEDFRGHLRDFLALNRNKIHAKKILVDFHRDSDPVSDFFLTAAERALAEFADENDIDEIALMK